jgi:hypothetical protein
MTRYGIAAAMLALYVGGAVWAVRREGENYRNSLQRGPAVSHVETHPSSLPVAKAEGPPGPPFPAPSPPAPPLAMSTAKAAPAPADAPAIEPAPAKAAPAAPVAPKPAAPAINTFWKLDAMTKTWDVDHLSVDDERRLGRALNELVLRFHHPVETGPEWQRVMEAAAPYLKARSRPQIEYTFTVLDSDACCAFSHPGGYVYVCRGLFDLIGKEEDYALEFVLAHEIAHVDRRHALECLQDPDLKGLKLGTLQAFFAVIFPRGYMDRLEYDADLWAYTRMTQLGRTKRERLAFLRKWQGYARTNGFENVRGLPTSGSTLSPFENHSRAHPSVYLRLKRLEELTKPDPVHGR